MRCRLVGLVLLALATPIRAQPEPVPAPPTTPEPAEPPPGEPPPAPVEPVAPPPVIAQPPVEASPPAPSAPSAAAPVAGAKPFAGGVSGFRFGSYGRVLAGTDLRGGKPESANVVAHGPRIVEASYLELDFSFGFDTPRGVQLRPVITLAFDGTLFHDTGEFDARPALRNMYLDAQVNDRISVWAGSRMYRGDDIYLFDYWPLDDLNTVGGGARYRRSMPTARGANALELAVHAGVNRLLRDFQFQEIDVANPEQGATTIVQLNRQRMVASAAATYLIDRGAAQPSVKLKLYGELHTLGSGTRRRIDGTFEQLPADTGLLIGAQAGAFGLAAPGSGFRRHLNLFARYTRGLASFDELAPPTSFGADLKTQRATELSLGASGNWDHARGSLLVGILSRRFVDADASAIDDDDGWEYAIAARPLVAVAPDLYAGADLSYQARFPRGLNPNTQLAEDPAVVQIAPMLVFSPLGSSGYDRPQLRLVYRAAHLNQGARDLFVPGDPRAAYTWTHFLGVQAEWWFNSSSYAR